jgi:enoyl-[acyl-carrier-protein] reductase (NADH)
MFLASPAARSITGQIVMVDGGASAGKFLPRTTPA